MSVPKMKPGLNISASPKKNHANTMLYSGSKLTDKFMVKGSKTFSALSEIVKAKLVQTNPSKSNQIQSIGSGIWKVVSVALK